jgi:F0F1-type ATP synthase assembly protein I
LSTVYWPLLGGFIAFVLVAIVLGWILDPARRRDGERH